MGNQGEHEIANLLHECGINQIRRPDFCIFMKGIWHGIEVKNKEPFQPPPAFMQGMPKQQYLNDLNMTQLGMPCILVVRGKNHDWLAQYLLKLKPQPDPRKIIKSTDEIIWFSLNQFKSFKEIFAENTGSWT
jgi:hypothetical protein